MSNALTVVSREAFTGLVASAESVNDEAMAALLETGEEIGTDDLQRVNVPGEGKTRWTVSTIFGDESFEELKGVFVYFQRAGVLWPSLEATGGLPVLVTDDLKVARKFSPIPDDLVEGCESARIDRVKHPEIYEQYGIPSDSQEQLFDWEKLPYNQFGTGKGGHGKRVKEVRFIYLLREGDTYPICVKCPSGSLKNVGDFFRKIPLAAKVPYYQCVISLRLESAISAAGNKYAKIKPSISGILDPETTRLVKEKFTDELAKLAKKNVVDFVSDAE